MVECNINTAKHPVLSAFVKAHVTVSTGLQVESLFSMMNNVINKKSGRMLTEIYSAITGTKYNVIASGEMSFELFCWKKHFKRSCQR